MPKGTPEDRSNKDKDSSNMLDRFANMKFSEQVLVAFESGGIGALLMMVSEYTTHITTQFQQHAIFFSGYCGPDTMCMIGSFHMLIEKSLPEIAGLLACITTIGVVFQSLGTHLSSPKLAEQMPWKHFSNPEKLVFLGYQLLSVALALGMVYSGLHAIMQFNELTMLATVFEEYKVAYSATEYAIQFFERLSVDIFAFIALIPGLIHITTNMRKFENSKLPRANRPPKPPYAPPNNKRFGR